MPRGHIPGSIEHQQKSVAGAAGTSPKFLRINQSTEFRHF
jgi:hypothetical protein